MSCLFSSLCLFLPILTHSFSTEEAINVGILFRQKGKFPLSRVNSGSPYGNAHWTRLAASRALNSPEAAVIWILVRKDSRQAQHLSGIKAVQRNFLWTE